MVYMNKNKSEILRREYQIPENKTNYNKMYFYFYIFIKLKCDLIE